METLLNTSNIISQVENNGGAIREQNQNFEALVLGLGKEHGFIEKDVTTVYDYLDVATLIQALRIRQYKNGMFSIPARTTVQDFYLAVEAARNAYIHSI